VRLVVSLNFRASLCILPRVRDDQFQATDGDENLSHEGVSFFSFRTGPDLTVRTSPPFPFRTVPIIFSSTTREAPPPLLSGSTVFSWRMAFSPFYGLIGFKIPHPSSRDRHPTHRSQRLFSSSPLSPTKCVQRTEQNPELNSRHRFYSALKSVGLFYQSSDIFVPLIDVFTGPCACLPRT